MAEWTEWKTSDELPQQGTYIQVETICTFCGKYRSLYEGIYLEPEGWIHYGSLRLISGPGVDEMCIPEVDRWRALKPPSVEFHVKRRESLDA